MKRTSVLSGRKMMLEVHSVGTEGGRKMQCFFVDVRIHCSVLCNFWLPVGDEIPTAPFLLIASRKAGVPFSLTLYHNQLHPQCFTADMIKLRFSSLSLSDCLLLCSQNLLNSWCFTLGNNSGRINFSNDCHLLHHSFSCSHTFSGPECISVTGHILIFCAALCVQCCLHTPCLAANIFRMLLIIIIQKDSPVWQFPFYWFWYHEVNRCTQYHWVWKAGATSLRAKTSQSQVFLTLLLLGFSRVSFC